MFGIEEIIEIETEVRSILDTNLEALLVKLNRTGELQSLLEMLGIESFSETPKYSTFKNGKIVIVGESKVSENDLKGIIKELDLDKDRFEFCLDYKEAKTFNYKKMQWNPSYCLVLVGPMPHSGYEKGEYGSVISALENEDGYPRVERLGTNELKITKSSFKIALEKMMAEGVIE